MSCFIFISSFSLSHFFLDAREQQEQNTKSLELFFEWQVICWTKDCFTSRFPSRSSWSSSKRKVKRKIKGKDRSLITKGCLETVCVLENKERDYKHITFEMTSDAREGKNKLHEDRDEGEELDDINRYLDNIKNLTGSRGGFRGRGICKSQERHTRETWPSVKSISPAQEEGGTGSSTWHDTKNIWTSDLRWVSHVRPTASRDCLVWGREEGSYTHTWCSLMYQDRNSVLVPSNSCIQDFNQDNKNTMRGSPTKGCYFMS